MLALDAEQKKTIQQIARGLIGSVIDMKVTYISISIGNFCVLGSGLVLQNTTMSKFYALLAALEKKSRKKKWSSKLKLVLVGVEPSQWLWISF